MKIDPQIGQKY